MKRRKREIHTLLIIYKLYDLLFTSSIYIKHNTGIFKIYLYFQQLQLFKRVHHFDVYTLRVRETEVKRNLYNNKFLKHNQQLSK